MSVPRWTRPRLHVIRGGVECGPPLEAPADAGWDAWVARHLSARAVQGTDADTGPRRMVDGPPAAAGQVRRMAERVVSADLQQLHDELETLATRHRAGSRNRPALLSLRLFGSV